MVISGVTEKDRSKCGSSRLQEKSVEAKLYWTACNKNHFLGPRPGRVKPGAHLRLRRVQHQHPAQLQRDAPRVHAAPARRRRHPQHPWWRVITTISIEILCLEDFPMAAEEKRMNVKLNFRGNVLTLYRAVANQLPP